MKLRIEEIAADAKVISFKEPEEEVNRVLGLGPIREYHVGGPIEVDLSYYRAGTELFFAGELRATAQASCARCAEEFAALSRRPFRFVLVPRAIGMDTESDLRNEDLELSVYDGDEVNLAPLIREQLLLALPTRPLCREDCRGLCAHCGINLNDHDCGCAKEAFDLRLAVLRSLKTDRSR